MVPRPWTGGGGKIAIMASLMPAYFCCSFCAIAMPDRSGDVRSSNGFSVTNTMPAFGLLMKPLIDRPGNATALCTPGSFSAMSRHLADDLFRAVERGAVGQLREADQILLVLRRHEARRHALEHEDGQPTSSTA